jgi:hypothetical protein
MPRTNELDADERRRIIRRRGSPRLVWGLYGRSLGVPAADWLTERSGMHPSSRLAGDGAAMTVAPGTGLLSQVIERGWAGSCGFASSPGVW